MNILVTGAKGQLGCEMQRLGAVSPNNYIFTDVAELDITNADAVMNAVKPADPGSLPQGGMRLPVRFHRRGAENRHDRLRQVGLQPQHDRGGQSHPSRRPPKRGHPPLLFGSVWPAGALGHRFSEGAL